MAIPYKTQKKQKYNTNLDLKQIAYENALKVSANFGLKLFRYFGTLDGVVNVDTNIDGGSVQFFEIKNDDPHWFGNTICFDYKTYSFRLYFGFNWNPDLPKVEELSAELWPRDIEPKNIYRHLANYWIQLNVSNTFEPYDGHSTFLLRFDASPDWEKIDLFPHHKHTYLNNKDEDGSHFDGTLNMLLDELLEATQAFTDFPPKK